VRKDDLDRQVDVSFPSSNLAKQIDMEIIGMRLSLCDINVENKFNEKEDEYCRRGTMQLERINGIEFYFLYCKTINKYFSIRC